MQDGYAIVRDGREDDAEALCELFRESWQGAYHGIIPDIDIRRMISGRSARYWKNLANSGTGLIVIEAGGKVAGYATIGRARSKGPYEGEIYEIYIAPNYQGLGLGELLFEAARTKLEEAGRRGLVVWALTDNELANVFYARRGGQLAGRTKQKFSDRSLEKIAFAFP